LPDGLISKGGREMKKILLTAWRIVYQLPQHLVGLILLAIYRPYKSGLPYYVSSKFRGAISLGEIIIIGQGCSADTPKHERGHTLQSRKLGPLYLLIIGIPSITWAGIWKHMVKHAKPGTVIPAYRSAPWEAWADRLGGKP
jgi:hypothetical protein